MKRYVVSYTSFYDNDIGLDLVEAVDWQSAVQKSRFSIDYVLEDTLNLEEAKQRAFDCDEVFSVLEIT